MAMETAGVVLMHDDLRRIPDTLRLAQKTHRVLWQNISLALGVKAVFFMLALLGLATMWLAVHNRHGRKPAGGGQRPAPAPRPARHFRPATTMRPDPPTRRLRLSAAAICRQRRPERRQRWRYLEAAHVLGQNRLSLHLRAHWQMLRFARRRLATSMKPGGSSAICAWPRWVHMVRRMPGNNGRAIVPALHPMVPSAALPGFISETMQAVEVMYRKTRRKTTPPGGP